MERESFRPEQFRIDRTPDEAAIRRYFELANTYFGIENPEDLIGPEYSIEQILQDVEDGRRYIQTIDQDNEVMGGSIATFFDTDRAHEMWGVDESAVLLEYTVLPEDARGVGYVEQLRTAQADWTREKGCHIQIGEVEFDNIPSCIALLKRGFVLFQAEHPEHEQPYFVAKKDIDNVKEVAYEEYDEISFSDIGDIEQKLADGWVGIDVRNLGELTELDKKQWMLIVAK